MNWLLAQTAEPAAGHGPELFGIPIEIAGAWGIVSVCLGALLWWARDYWNLKKPMIKKKDETSIRLQETLTANSSQQTEILECMKETLRQHGETCLQQAHKECQVLEGIQEVVAVTNDLATEANGAVAEIHEGLAAFRKDAVDPNAPFSTVGTNKMVETLLKVAHMATVAVEHATILPKEDLPEYVKIECEKIRTALGE